MLRSNDTVTVASVGISFPLAAAYEDVEFDESATEDEQDETGWHEQAQNQ